LITAASTQSLSRKAIKLDDAGANIQKSNLCLSLAKECEALIRDRMEDDCVMDTDAKTRGVLSVLSLFFLGLSAVFYLNHGAPGKH
jgi:hypothetical protein